MQAGLFPWSGGHGRAACGWFVTLPSLGVCACVGNGAGGDCETRDRARTKAGCKGSQSGPLRCWGSGRGPRRWGSCSGLRYWGSRPGPRCWGSRPWANAVGKQSWARPGSGIYCSLNCFIAGKICSATGSGLHLKENIGVSWWLSG